MQGALLHVYRPISLPDLLEGKMNRLQTQLQLKSGTKREDVALMDIEESRGCIVSYFEKVPTF